MPGVDETLRSEVFTVMRRLGRAKSAVVAAELNISTQRAAQAMRHAREGAIPGQETVHYDKDSAVWNYIPAEYDDSWTVPVADHSIAEREEDSFHEQPQRISERYSGESETFEVAERVATDEEASLLDGAAPLYFYHFYHVEYFPHGVIRYRNKNSKYWNTLGVIGLPAKVAISDLKLDWRGIKQEMSGLVVEEAHVIYRQGDVIMTRKIPNPSGCITYAVLENELLRMLIKE